MTGEDRIERFTMANQYPIPVLGQRPPTAAPSTSTDWVKVATSAASGAVSFTGMKEGQIWLFEIFDATTPATATPNNVHYRPYDGVTAAATTDARHWSRDALERRILAGQVGYSFKPIAGDVIVNAVRLL